jgi:hypothetical protein
MIFVATSNGGNGAMISAMRAFWFAEEDIARTKLRRAEKEEPKARAEPENRAKMVIVQQ